MFKYLLLFIYDYNFKQTIICVLYIPILIFDITKY